MYNWRKMSEAERAKTLAERKERNFTWHAPPHFKYVGSVRFLLTAACYEHKPIIGITPERMAASETELLALCEQWNIELFAWCILPNHYHLMIQTDKIREFQEEALRAFHGNSAFRWNGEDNARGRKVWYKSFERKIRSTRHFWASLNYVHQNPVKHGYVTRWQDWPYSSAHKYLDEVGREKAREIWREYPVLDYGKDWDFD